MKFRRLSLGKVEGEPGIDDRGQPRARDERLIANDQVGFGPAQERGLALRGHRGGRVVIDAIKCQPGHVALVAVLIMSHHAELARARLAERDGAGLDRDSHNGPVRFAASFGSAVANPRQQGVIFRRADRQPAAAAVGDRSGRPWRETGSLREPAARQPALAAVSRQGLKIAGRS